MTFKVVIKKTNPNLEISLPCYETKQSAGMDLKAALTQEEILKAGQVILVPTGIAIALPEGYEAQVRSRSGLALKNQVVVLNSPGTIDADYRGEIKVILKNHSSEDFTLTPGMRIAQMVIAPIVQATWNEQAELPNTDRGVGGFGSTGI